PWLVNTVRSTRVICGSSSTTSTFDLSAVVVFIVFMICLWQQDHHRGALRNVGVDPDASPLRLDEAPRDRQAEADAAAARVVRLALGHAEEFFEDALREVERDAGTLIRHGDPQLMLGLAHGRH